MARIRIAANIALTPPSLLGTDRRMAYAHKKYHSGLIWGGVDRGFAGMKFSGSLKVCGAKKTIKARMSVARTIPSKSLVV